MNRLQSLFLDYDETESAPKSECAFCFVSYDARLPACPCRCTVKLGVADENSEFN